MISASFEGDSSNTATAYAYTPYGDQYAICTTVQYGYKPSSNSATLTVEPQATEVTQLTKTPEQLQQEARMVTGLDWKMSCVYVLNSLTSS